MPRPPRRRAHRARRAGALPREARGKNAAAGAHRDRRRRIAAATDRGRRRRTKGREMPRRRLLQPRRLDGAGVRDDCYSAVATPCMHSTPSAQGVAPQDAACGARCVQRARTSRRPRLRSAQRAARRRERAAHRRAGRDRGDVERRPNDARPPSRRRAAHLRRRRMSTASSRIQMHVNYQGFDMGSGAAAAVPTPEACYECRPRARAARRVRAPPAAQAERVRVLPQAEGLRGGRVVLGRHGERDRRKVTGSVGIRSGCGCARVSG